MQNIKKQKNRNSVTVTIPLDIAETLQAFLDGGIGTSADDEFTRKMSIVLKKLNKQVAKYYDYSTAL